MIPQSTNREIEANIPNSVQSAKIEVNGMAFKVLSSNLYTDRVLAIIRELSCNAWDAHAMVGKTNTPFEVFLPSELKPELRIRDFGPGLSTAELPNVYTTFFGSTKRDSNSQIGGFGLGSKSPLSYTDAFSVSSYQNGKVCNYAIFLQKNGAPGVTLINEASTDKPDGLEVTMPVEPRHIDEFVKRAHRALRHFPTMPRVLGAKIEARKYTVKSALFGIYDAERHNSTTSVIMGHVAYPISINALDGSTQHKFYDVLRNSNIDIFMPIGSLEIQPSREALSYDEETKTKIHATLEQILDELTNTIQGDINKAKTFPDAMAVYSQARSNTWRAMNNQVFTWRNRRINCHTTKVKGPANGLATIDKYDWNKSKLTLRYDNKESVTDLKSLVVIWHDLGTGPYLKILNFNKMAIGTNALVVRGDKTDLRTVLKQLGIRRFITLSQLPVPPKESAVSIAKNTSFGTISRRGGFQRPHYGGGVTAAQVDELNEEGKLVWVGVNNINMLGQAGVEPVDLQNAISHVHNLYTFDVQIIAIPRGAKQLEKVVHSPLVPYLHAQLARYEAEHDVPQLIANSKRVDYKLPDSSGFTKLTEDYRGKHPQSTLAKFIRAYSKAPTFQSGKVQTYLHACALLGRIPQAANKITLSMDLPRMHKIVSESYPLLALMSDRFWGTEDGVQPNVTQYLEALDNERNTLLHSERTVANNLRGGRAKKRELRTPQVDRNSRRAKRGTLPGNTRADRHVGDIISVHVHN